MKLLTKSLLFTIFCILNLNVWAKIHVFSPYKRYHSAKLARGSPRKRSNQKEILERIERQNRIIEEILRQKGERPLVGDFTQKFDILTGTTLRARLLNPILSNNLNSPILVEILENSDLPKGSRLSCKGSLKNKRVEVSCTQLILNQHEYEVAVQVLDLDGSAGISGEIYSSELQDFASKVSQNVLEGAAKHYLGQINNAPKLFKQARDSLIKEKSPQNQGSNSQITIIIPAGRVVLIYFQRRFIL